MNPHRLTWGFAYDFPFAQVVAVTTLLAVVISKESKQIPWTRESKVLLVFTTWMFITTLFALKPHLAWMQWNQVWKIQLMTFVTLMLMGTRDRLHIMIWVIVLSLGFYGVKGGIFTIVTGGSYRVLGPAKSFIGVRGGIGLALIMTIPLMRYLQLNTNRAWVRLGLSAAMGLTAFAIMGTLSRGAFLGFTAMGFFLIMKSRRKFLYGILALITAASIFSFMPQEWNERMETIQHYEQDGSAMGRIDAWQFAIRTAKKNSLTGGGYEVFVRHGTDAHSIWFEVLGEHGFIGLALFLILGLMAWRSCSWIIKNAKDNHETRWIADLAGMVQVSMVGYAVAGSFLGLAYFDLYYHLVAVVILCKAILSKHLVEQETSDLVDVQQVSGVSRMPVRT
jgi:probable O-glycosylation ligase (exosortase A-associated)